MLRGPKDWDSTQGTDIKHRPLLKVMDALNMRSHALDVHLRKAKHQEQYLIVGIFSSEESEYFQIIFTIPLTLR